MTEEPQKLDVSLTLEKRRDKLKIYLKEIPTQILRQEEEGNEGYMNPEETVIEHDKDPEFDLGLTLKDRHGPFIEIAGPTDRGIMFVDYEKLDKPVLVSNTEIGLPIWDDQTGDLVTYWGRVDFRADSRRLPLRDKSVGAFFGSCLIDHTIEQTLKETYRALEENGVFVIQEADPKVLQQAKEVNFIVREARTVKGPDGVPVTDAIFQKGPSLKDD